MKFCIRRHKLLKADSNVNTAQNVCDWSAPSVSQSVFTITEQTYANQPIYLLWGQCLFSIVSNLNSVLNVKVLVDALVGAFSISVITNLRVDLRFKLFM